MVVYTAGRGSVGGSERMRLEVGATAKMLYNSFKCSCGHHCVAYAEEFRASCCINENLLVGCED